MSGCKEVLAVADPGGALGAEAPPPLQLSYFVHSYYSVYV